jgi:hypothetical protein
MLCLAKENSTGKTQMETCSVWQREKKGKKSSEAESFRHMKIKISYILEDGHVGRNMWWKTVKTNTIELQADGNITCKTHWTIQCSRMLKYSILRTFLTVAMQSFYWIHQTLIIMSPWQSVVKDNSTLMFQAQSYMASTPMFNSATIRNVWHKTEQSILNNRSGQN